MVLYTIIIVREEYEIKKINIIRFLVIIVIIAALLAIHTNAVSVIRAGYYQKIIYIQNKATGIYSSAVIQGVANWNNAGISPRSVVINTSSSSKVYDDPFTSAALADAAGAYGLYLPIADTNSTCDCHETTIFNIFLNRTVINGNSAFAVSTAAHELGHAFGLNDDNGSDLTMLMHGQRQRSRIASPKPAEVQRMLQWWNDNH